MDMYRAAGVNVLMMDYRGYGTILYFLLFYTPGSSTGEPTEDGLNNDGDAVLQFAASHPKYVYVFLVFRLTCLQAK